MKKTVKLLSAILFIMLLASCATTVSVVRQRPAELDLNGATSISVLPIQTSKFDSYDPFEFLKFFRHRWDRKDPKQEIASYVTEELQEKLLNSDYLTVVGSKKVEAAIENGDEIPCDVYLSGYISRWDDEFESKRKVNDDDEVYYEYYRRVSFTLVYEILDSETGQIIQNRRTDISGTSSKYKHKHDVPDAFEIVKWDLDSLVRKIMRELQPYEETKTISLLKDKSKNPDFKEAEQLVKDKYIDDAIDLFIQIFEETGSFEAGYNAARLLQVVGDFEEAEDLMQNIYNATGNKKALSALKDIRYEWDAEETLKYQQDQQDLRK